MTEPDLVEWSPLGIEFSFTQSFNKGPEFYSKEIRGKIYCSAEEDIPVEAGDISIILMDIEAGHWDGHSASTMMDIDARIYAFYPALFGKNESSLRRKIRNIFDDRLNDNVLIIDRVEIKPEFRGRDLGLKAIHLAIAQFSTYGLAAIKAFPLQFEGREEEEDVTPGLKQERIKAERKLKEYYSRLGFVSIGYDNILVMDPHLSCNPVPGFLHTN